MVQQAHHDTVAIAWRMLSRGHCNNDESTILKVGQGEAIYARVDGYLCAVELTNADIR